MRAVADEDPYAAEGMGVAAAVGLDLAAAVEGTARPLYQALKEGPTLPDPIAAAHAFIDSIKDDWPGHTFTVVANERACYLAWRRRMEAWVGPGDYSPAAYVATRPETVRA